MGYLKKLNRKMNRSVTSIIILFFLVIYLLFPSQNSSIDAFYYAASIKHSGELFHPHHLLYNLTGFLFLKAVNGIGIFPDVLAFLKILNALVAAVCLIIVNRILKRMGKGTGEIAGFLFLAGSNFALLRFATENEVYLFPLALSLLASLGFINYLKRKKIWHLFIAGIFSSLAILYHQIHLCWWLGLLIGIIVHSRKWKAIILYSLPALLIPIIYIIVFVALRNRDLIEGNLMHFVFRDFYSGGVDMTFDWSNLYLTGINFIRSYVQVHGLMFFLVKKSMFYILPGIIASFLLISALVQKKFMTGNASGGIGIFIKTHGFIFILQLIFALYAVGNAEFMVMLPLLTVLIIAGLYDIEKRSLYLAGAALFLWNMGYGILPLWKADHTPDQKIIEWVDTHKTDLFILMGDQHIISKIYYSSGMEEVPNLQKSPEHMVSRGQSLSLLRARIDRSLASGSRVFTDCIDRPGIISREQLLDRGINHEFFGNYRSFPIDSVTTIAGTYFLHEIVKRELGDDLPGQ
jgi:hypothetical protein